MNRGTVGEGKNGKEKGGLYWSLPSAHDDMMCSEAGSLVDPPF